LSFACIIVAKRRPGLSSGLQAAEQAA